MSYVAAIPRCRAERFLVVEVVDQPPCQEAPEPFDQVFEVMAFDDMPVERVDQEPVEVRSAPPGTLEAAAMAAAVRARRTGWAVGCVRWVGSRRCMVDRWVAEPVGRGLPLGKQIGPCRRN